MESYRVYKSLPLSEYMDMTSFVMAKIGVLMTPDIQDINYLKAMHEYSDDELKQQFVQRVLKELTKAEKEGREFYHYTDMGAYLMFVPARKSVRECLIMIRMENDIAPLMLQMIPECTSDTIADAVRQAVEKAVTDGVCDGLSSIPDDYLYQYGLERGPVDVLWYHNRYSLEQIRKQMGLGADGSYDWYYNSHVREVQMVMEHKGNIYDLDSIVNVQRALGCSITYDEYSSISATGKYDEMGLYNVTSADRLGLEEILHILHTEVDAVTTEQIQ
jgi:hypothetical protein